MSCFKWDEPKRKPRKVLYHATMEDARKKVSWFLYNRRDSWNASTHYCAKKGIERQTSEQSKVCHVYLSLDDLNMFQMLLDATAPTPAQEGGDE